MRVIEIKALDNGAHRNQTGNFATIPEGYAQIPDDMPVPDTFPFVNIEVSEGTRYNEIPYYNEKIEKMEIERIPYTVMVVTSMTAGVMPEPAPARVPDNGNESVTWDALAKAYSEGVNSID